VPLVAEEFRPTLREELARHRPFTRRAIVALLVLVALAWVGFVLRPTAKGIPYVHRGDPVFNLRYGAGFTRMPAAADEYLHIRRKPRGRVLDSFAIGPLKLPPYQGDVNGLLPVYAERVLTELRNAHPDLKLIEEGKARVNLVVGYSLLFQAGRGKDRMFGREILLPQPTPGARTGVRMALRTWRGSGVTDPRSLGAVGSLRIPYRSFRYGTEAP
jgi:hypothetical protein